MAISFSPLDTLVVILMTEDTEWFGARNLAFWVDQDPYDLKGML